MFGVRGPLDSNVFSVWEWTASSEGETTVVDCIYFISVVACAALASVSNRFAI